MSTVYLSYDVTGGHPVAVKLLADHLAHAREFVSRFYREARLSRLLSHPNLVRGLAAGFDPVTSKHYLILEFIDGPTAHTALTTRGTFPVGVAVKVGIDIARALEFLHSRQYVHRDVKPDNVLLHPSGVAKLADLGLAKRLNDDPQLTSVAQGVGTSYYMAYEQALNPNFVDGRSDIFALGATLYHLLTGKLPFPGSTHEEVIRGKEDDAFTPIREHTARIPGTLANLIDATLARDPRARLQSAGELADALEATGLATTIPTLGPEDTDCGLGSEAPTRADLKTFTREVSSGAPPIPPTESFTATAGRKLVTPPVTAEGTEGTGGSAQPVRGTLGLVAGIGLVTGVALAGITARTSPYPDDAGTQHTVMKRSTGGSQATADSSDGLPPLAPQ
jgi:serine/threonine-protein kinase